MSAYERDDGGEQEDLDQEVVELLEDELPEGLALLGRELCKQNMLKMSNNN